MKQISQEVKSNICPHGCSYGYCNFKCIKFSSMKEKIANDRRLFLKQFRQTPRPLASLLERKTLSRMNLITKETFVRRLVEYNKLERQAKY